MDLDIQEYDKNRYRLKILILGRVIVITFFLAGAVFTDYFEPSYFISRDIFQILYAIIGMTYVLSAFYAYLLKKDKYFLLNIYLQLAVDIILITFVVYLTGSIGSNYSLLYTLVIIFSVIFLGRSGGLIVASVASIAYGTLLDLEYYRIIPTLFAAGRDYSVNSTDVFVRILVHIFSFYGIAVLASFVVEQEKKTRSLLEEKESAFNQLDLLFRSIIESVDTGILTVNLQGRIKTFNRAAEEITGKSLKVVENKRIDEVFPSFSPFILQRRSDLLRSRYEALITGRKNEELHVGCSVSPLKDRYGRQIGHILIFQDLTDVKKMEERLEKSRRLALIGEMAAGLAHEMRNPLASITGSIQLLAQTDHLEETEKRLMQIILRGKDQLDHFVSDFLLLARPIPQVRENVDVNTVANETLDNLSIAPGWKQGITIRRRFGAENIVWGNPEPIRQIIRNLILNGVQAMEESGELCVDIQANSFNDRRSFVEIKVSDSGCGIEEKDLRKVFEPFFTNKEGGTGLGLAIVSRIVDGYEGKIDIESHLNQGTTITVRLPAPGR